MLGNDIFVYIKITGGEYAPSLHPCREHLVDLHYSCICHHIVQVQEIGALFGIEDVQIGVVKPHRLIDVRHRMRLIQKVEDVIHYMSASVELPDFMRTPPLFHKYCFCDVPILPSLRPCPCFKKGEKVDIKNK